MSERNGGYSTAMRNGYEPVSFDISNISNKYVNDWIILLFVRLD